MRNRRDDEFPGIFEPDESAIEQLVDTGRQEKSVFTIKSLFICYSWNEREAGSSVKVKSLAAPAKIGLPRRIFSG
jgi:hypothetical protein